MKKSIFFFFAVLLQIACIAQVGVGTTTPHSTLDIRGSLATNYRVFTADTIADATDNVLVFIGLGNAVLTLPSAVGIAGRIYHIKNASSTLPTPALSVRTTFSETIDGLTVWTLPALYAAVSIVSTGSNWHLVNFQAGGGASTGEGVVINSGIAGLGNNDGSRRGELLSNRYITTGPNSIIFKGTSDDRSEAFMIFDDEFTATPGSPQGREIFRILPLDRTGYTTPAPFSMSLSATAYDGVDKRDNVINFGWNLAFGGGQLVPGVAGGGESWEHHYEPTAGNLINFEKHEFYITTDGVQKRLSSYTINEAQSSYDFYHTVSRHYYKKPSNDAVYAMIQPSMDGAQLSLAYTETENFNIIYDHTSGVNFNLAGSEPARGSRSAYFNGFDGVSLPGMSVQQWNGEIRLEDGMSFLPTTSNFNDLGNTSYRWKALHVNSVGIAGSPIDHVYSNSLTYGRKSSLQASPAISTTDATPLLVWSEHLDEGSMGVAEVIVCGTLTGGAAGIVGKKIVKFAKTIYGIGSIGTPVVLMADDVDAAVSGTTWRIYMDDHRVCVEVTGIATATMNWTVDFKKVYAQ